MIVMVTFRIWLWKNYKLRTTQVKKLPREDRFKIQQEYALSEGQCFHNCDTENTYLNECYYCPLKEKDVFEDGEINVGPIPATG